MGLIALRCPYCGGQLIPIGPHYECTCCGNLVIQDNSLKTQRNNSKQNHGSSHILYITDPLTFKYTFTGEIQFKFNYRKRVTLADKFPMDVSVIANDRPISFIDEFENVGSGTLTLSVTGETVLVSKQGRLKANAEGIPLGSFSEYTLGTTITVGSLNFKIE